eukprot:750433-Hanusia_phi.AAC.3
MQKFARFRDINPRSIKLLGGCDVNHESEVERHKKHRGSGINTSAYCSDFSRVYGVDRQV